MGSVKHGVWNMDTARLHPFINTQDVKCHDSTFHFPSSVALEKEKEKEGPLLQEGV